MRSRISSLEIWFRLGGRRLGGLEKRDGYVVEFVLVPGAGFVGDGLAVAFIPISHINTQPPRKTCIVLPDSNPSTPKAWRPLP